MYRDIDPRSDERERERPDLARGGRGATDEERSRPVDESRDAFSRDLDLPRGSTRERIRIDGRDYALRGSEVRTLGTVGAFRVVPAEELRRPGESVNVLRKDLDHLRDLGLVRTMPYVVGRERTTVVTLTDRGRALLEGARRPHDEGRQQAYYAGIAKERELAHDSRVHRAYPTLLIASSPMAGGSAESCWNTSSSASINRSCRRPTVAERTARGVRNAMPSRSPGGLRGTTCQSLTDTCNSRMSGSSSRLATDVSTCATLRS